MGSQLILFVHESLRNVIICVVNLALARTVLLPRPSSYAAGFKVVAYEAHMLQVQCGVTQLARAQLVLEPDT